MRWTAILAAALLWAAMAAPVRADVAKGNEACLECHSGEGMTMTLPDGTDMSVTVDVDSWQKSVHGTALACTDCHSDITEYPHPERNYQTRRAYTLGTYEACKQCHFEHYTRTLESIHYTLLAKGDRNAPVCVDCHGAHDVSRPAEPRGRISETCSKCHDGAYRQWSASVHGKASADTPVCTDCHSAHSIQDPTSRQFGLRTPEMCGGCHADEQRMKPYGLSTNVLKTYLQDFHGVSVQFQRAEDGSRSGETIQPVCTDCHGVHDIARTDDANSAVMQENLVATCRKCHPEATANFPQAWLGHYEPTLEDAPLVFAINLFYGILIPFMIVGLVVQIVLHIWRVALNR